VCNTNDEGLGFAGLLEADKVVLWGRAGDLRGKRLVGVKAVTHGQPGCHISASNPKSSGASRKRQKYYVKAVSHEDLSAPGPRFFNAMPNSGFTGCHEARRNHT
jgi:hypothetical protein